MKQTAVSINYTTHKKRKERRRKKKRTRNACINKPLQAHIVQQHNNQQIRGQTAEECSALRVAGGIAEIRQLHQIEHSESEEGEDSGIDHSRPRCAVVVVEKEGKCGTEHVET